MATHSSILAWKIPCGPMRRPSPPGKQEWESRKPGLWKKRLFKQPLPHCHHLPIKLWVFDSLPQPLLVWFWEQDGDKVGGWAFSPRQETWLPGPTFLQSHLLLAPWSWSLTCSHTHLPLSQGA